MSTETEAQRARHTPGDSADGFIRWQLHDCSGVQEALLRHEMCAWFTRWRRLRSKGVTETRTVTKRSLIKRGQPLLIAGTLRRARAFGS
ncbi:hypothetical protein PC128_g13257 [Phytophthora cactorum]|nr:hypothetical protein PC120_g4933 [Phytophthora cactorum]KAG3082213.1 hypothetical protein PC121_g6202 [Phytophthora cactorum]KAG3185641.1 hypothetical protein PC128_g13257 [Phytophthora cactorum]KAG4059600.1 hypothetical protein PC123_g5468 [Phytophthora cactorum]